MAEKVSVFEVFLFARNVIHQIGLDKDTPLVFPISLQGGIYKAVRAIMSLKYKQYDIYLKATDTPVYSVRGMVTRYENPDFANIHFSTRQSKCWQRYVICKELAHLLMDTEDAHFTGDIETHIQGLVSELHGIDLNAALSSEYSAMLLALEILIPWKLRGIVLGMKNSGGSDLQIAKYCLVPEKFVNIFLSKNFQIASTNGNELLDRDAEFLI
jgi:Zn-dependent peptidase ImmA (M78 family)